MWILFPRIPNEDCAKKFAEENIRALPLLAISTMYEIKRSFLIKRNPKSSKLLLSFTQRATLGLKMFPTLWRKKGFYPVAEREATKTESPLSFPILFTTDTSVMQATSTKAKLMNEKKTLEEKIITLEQKQNDWLEPPSRREKGTNKTVRKWLK